MISSVSLSPKPGIPTVPKCGDFTFSSSYLFNLYYSWDLLGWTIQNNNNLTYSVEKSLLLWCQGWNPRLFQAKSLAWGTLLTDDTYHCVCGTTLVQPDIQHQYKGTSAHLVFWMDICTWHSFHSLPEASGALLWSRPPLNSPPSTVSEYQIHIHTMWVFPLPAQPSLSSLPGMFLAPRLHI